MNNKEWHNMGSSEVLSIMQTNAAKGLSTKEATKRLTNLGPNRIQERKKANPIKMFLSQFTDFMVLVLLAATMISGLLGEYADAITIMAIVVVNAILGFIQEFKAEKSLEALKSLTAPEAVVVREGEKIKIPAEELVPGDIIFLETGDKVPADCRLIEIVKLEAEESALTGESLPVKKNVDVISEQHVGIGDRRNMVYLGTVVTRGRARAVVVATGMDTEMGQIAGMMQEVENTETPLQKRLAALGKWLVAFCLLICAVVVVTGILRGEPVYRMFLAGVSLAVAAIPEGLPAIVTVALAIGVQKMIKRNAIVRKLPAVETLGCATVICSDKTGTITENEMTVRKLYGDGKIIEVTGQGYNPKGDFLEGEKKVVLEDGEATKLLLKIAAVCNNSILKKDKLKISGLFRNNSKNNGRWEIEGDPTEGALTVVAAKAGIWKDAVEKDEEWMHEFPFDSDRKMMSVVYKNKDNNFVSYVKGAPDVILSLCTHIYENGQIVALNEDKKMEIVEQNKAMASRALRVLGFAYKNLGSEFQAENGEELAEKDLVFVGLAGMIDPPRPSAIRAIKSCRQAGIKPVIITGDYKLTAEAIAREMGLITSSEQTISGEELDCLNDRELQKRVEDLVVYARVSPKHKMRIVKALKKNGHVVAMTGDGVNDAPAVKEADIGVSMGKTGTDVTKEASAMVLADDNFATIVAAVEEGRAIYDNIRKFIRYLLSCNVGEVLTMFLAALCGLPLPLMPIQILWVNLVTDGLPAMALGVDNADMDIMERPPRSPGESVFSHGLSRKIISRGLQICLQTLFIFIVAMILGDGDLKIARTMAFTTLVFSQLFHVFDCKSERFSPFQVGILSNPYLVGAVLCSITMQLSVIYLPFLQPIFKTVPLNMFQWAMIIFAAGWRTFALAIIHFLRPLGRKLVYLRV